jgi:hypothetical protein
MTFRSRTHVLVAPLVALLALTGCEDSSNLDDDIEVVRLNIGTQTITLDTGGLRDCCDGEGDATLNIRVTIPNSGSARTQLVYATFHRADGSNITLDPDVIEIRMSPASGSLTWTPLTFPNGTNWPFSGNLSRTSAGITNVEFTVVQRTSGSALFGPHTFRVCTANQSGSTTECAS